MTYIKRGEDRFTGPAKKLGTKSCTLKRSHFEKELLLIGDLVELKCQTPQEDEVDVVAQKLIKSKGKPFVVSNASGTMVMVISRDAMIDQVPVETARDKLNKAIELHASFHGVDYDDKDNKPIKKVNIEEPAYLVFFGWLNYIVYKVPNYSERRGTPFIHEAKDRGDEKPPAKKKPFVCISPKQDYLVMYGSQFEFTERGIIG
jgi:hypothetical protein